MPVPVIEGKTNIATMLQDYPQTIVVLKKYHLACFGCHGLKHETIALGATAHGVDLVALLHDLNAAL